MRVAFVTHNELGRACIEELHGLGADLTGVFTRPPGEDIADQIDLRGFARSRDIPLHEVESVNVDPVVERIQSCDPELLFVVGWSRLVEPRVIDLASVATLGMHPAPLPRGRGRAPIAWSLIKGHEETALSLFHLVEEADAGDLVGQRPIRIGPEDDAASIYGEVVNAGRELIREYYPVFERGDVPRTPQDDDEATWWPKREPHHGLIDWSQPAGRLYDWIRGQTHPYPGAFSYLDGQKVRIWAAAPPSGDRVFATPGEILGPTDDGLRVAAWEEPIELTRVEVGEDRETAATSLLSEYGFEAGDVFTNARDVLRD